MKEFTSHANHSFCWIDLATTDLDAAKNFYGKLFGWDVFEDSDDSGERYFMFTLNSKPVAGLFEKTPEMAEIPPHWMPYITTEDMDAVLGKVEGAGGAIIAPKHAFGDAGSKAMISDSVGAYVALWQPGEHIGTVYKYIPGSMSWTEHASHKMMDAIVFFEKVFDWVGKTDMYGEMNYTTFTAGEEMVCGMYEMPEGMKDIPPHWLTYFAVEKIDDSLNIVKENGADILMDKAYIQGVGHFAVIRDPQGSVFGLIEGEEM
ncbi:MAG: VOC family protein [Candidatus Kapaibacterium sp.]